jgi:hypothetical protein
MGTALAVELVEDQVHGDLHLLVGIQGEARARGVANVTGRGEKEQLAPRSLVALPTEKTRAEQMQLSLTHGPFEPKEETIVVVARVVQTVLVGEQGVEKSTQLEELVPVLTGTGQATHLQAEDDANMIQTNLGKQTLEAKAVLGTPTAQAKVVVDDFDAISGPTEGFGTLGEAVLAIGRFAVLESLVRGRLADINDRFFSEMVWLDFAGVRTIRSPKVRPPRGRLKRSHERSSESLCEGEPGVC